MNYKLIFIALILSNMSVADALAQDAAFTQWENMPVYLNPALTGNFEGLLRVRAQYRDQWKSLLQDNSYKTSAVSAEYRFSGSGDREISVGALFIRDKAGSLDFRNESMNVSTSVIQYLGNPDKAFHSVAIGFNVGWASRKLDFENAQWPGPPPTDIKDKTSYPDVSAGLLWQYKSNTHFSFQLGSALHHFNSPNVSLSDSSVSTLNQRINLHGNIEIPLVRNFSVVPSFLLSSQGPSEQLLFGLNNRWYPKSSCPNFVQLGLFAKKVQNQSGATDVNAYVLSATAEFHSFRIGFSFDRFQNIESNAYEFSLGYTFRKHDSKVGAYSNGYSQAGIVK